MPSPARSVVKDVPPPMPAAENKLQPAQLVQMLASPHLLNLTDWVLRGGNGAQVVSLAAACLDYEAAPLLRRATMLPVLQEFFLGLTEQVKTDQAVQAIAATQDVTERERRIRALMAEMLAAGNDEALPQHENLPALPFLAEYSDLRKRYGAEHPAAYLASDGRPVLHLAAETVARFAKSRYNPEAVARFAKSRYTAEASAADVANPLSVVARVEHELTEAWLQALAYLQPEEYEKLRRGWLDAGGQPRREWAALDNFPYQRFAKRERNEFGLSLAELAMNHFLSRVMEYRLKKHLGQTLTEDEQRVLAAFQQVTGFDADDIHLASEGPLRGLAQKRNARDALIRDFLTSGQKFEEVNATMNVDDRRKRAKEIEAELLKLRKGFLNWKRLSAAETIRHLLENYTSDNVMVILEVFKRLLIGDKTYHTMSLSPYAQGEAGELIYAYAHADLKGFYDRRSSNVLDLLEKQNPEQFLREEVLDTIMAQLIRDPAHFGDHLPNFYNERKAIRGEILQKTLAWHDKKRNMIHDRSRLENYTNLAEFRIKNGLPDQELAMLMELTTDHQALEQMVLTLMDYLYIPDGARPDDYRFYKEPDPAEYYAVLARLRARGQQDLSLDLKKIFSQRAFNKLLGILSGTARQDTVEQTTDLLNGRGDWVWRAPNIYPASHLDPRGLAFALALVGQFMAVDPDQYITEENLLTLLAFLDNANAAEAFGISLALREVVSILEKRPDLFKRFSANGMQRLLRRSFRASNLARTTALAIAGDPDRELPTRLDLRERVGLDLRVRWTQEDLDVVSRLRELISLMQKKGLVDTEEVLVQGGKPVKAILSIAYNKQDWLLYYLSLGLPVDRIFPVRNLGHVVKKFLYSAPLAHYAAEYTQLFYDHGAREAFLTTNPEARQILDEVLSLALDKGSFKFHEGDMEVMAMRSSLKKGKRNVDVFMRNRLMEKYHLTEEEVDLATEEMLMAVFNEALALPELAEVADFKGKLDFWLRVQLTRMAKEKEKAENPLPLNQLLRLNRNIFEEIYPSEIRKTHKAKADDIWGNAAKVAKLFLAANAQEAPGSGFKGGKYNWKQGQWKDGQDRWVDIAALELPLPNTMIPERFEKMKLRQPTVKADAGTIIVELSDAREIWEMQEALVAAKEGKKVEVESFFAKYPHYKTRDFFIRILATLNLENHLTEPGLLPEWKNSAYSLRRNPYVGEQYNSENANPLARYFSQAERVQAYYFFKHYVALVKAGLIEVATWVDAEMLILAFRAKDVNPAIRWKIYPGEEIEPAIQRDIKAFFGEVLKSDQIELDQVFDTKNGSLLSSISRYGRGKEAFFELFATLVKQGKFPIERTFTPDAMDYMVDSFINIGEMGHLGYQYLQQFADIWLWAYEQAKENRDADRLEFLASQIQQVFSDENFRELIDYAGYRENDVIVENAVEGGKIFQSIRTHIGRPLPPALIRSFEAAALAEWPSVLA